MSKIVGRARKPRCSGRGAFLASASEMESVLAAATPSPWLIAPFVLLLAAIALAPLFFAGWWGRHYPKVAVGLGAVVVGYYLFGLGAHTAVLHTAQEYFSFICLIGSLYVVSGGIVVRVRGEATPLANTTFLLVGAILANFVGTTGASMLLIRPWLRMNKYRLTAHHVVFFILVVSNVGGCLTPIGDPPLYIGYLLGVPFWWVAEHCWPMWLTGVGLLLAMFAAVDWRNYLKAPKAVRQELAEPPDSWQFLGLPNLCFLGVILGAVFVTKPPFVREALMLAAAAGSYFTTPKRLHAANEFNFHPVQEVAILFVGIFATMMPALDLLQANAGRLGSPGPGMFYWASGALSSVLDNAPTYLCFLKAIFGAYVQPEVVTQVQALVAQGLAEPPAGPHAEAVRQTLAALQDYHAAALAAKRVSTDEIEVAYLLGDATLSKFITAVSCGAVFFGANTYIGNGPNFMVKAIADQQGAKTPSFLGYIGRFTIPFMLPMLLVVWLLFFR
jgi:Na+/H+ antiporter NhaD/arsenite permease-like protein